MNDKVFSEHAKKLIDAIQILARLRMDFIEQKGLLNEYNKFMEKKFNVKNPYKDGN
jgi:hypothetical protein